MSESSLASPNWDNLFDTAVAQEGHFTTRQAAEAGFTPQLLAHHLKAGRMVRVRRGIYRLVHYPASDHEELTVVWLWSSREGVFSHQTALALHDLSDILPARVHITLPPSWRRRRLRVPRDVVLHYGEIDERERQWFGPVPVTRPLRTLQDSVASSISPELIHAAMRDAIALGLVTEDELGDVEAMQQVHGGLDP